jgi:hypothetical protein
MRDEVKKREKMRVVGIQKGPDERERKMSFPNRKRRMNCENYEP